MGAMRCCDDASTESGNAPTTASTRLTFSGRLREIAGWIVPAAGLTLVPKCPVCLAAYIAVCTGVGVSAPTATYIRMFLLLTFGASLSYIAAKRINAFMK